jgi:hypothetical protein
MDIIDLHAASIILGVPEFLVRDFVSYDFNGRKLRTVDGGSNLYTFAFTEVHAFREHMEASWLGTDRQDPPEYVVRYLVYESQAVCALCRQAKPNYEIAHITSWRKTRCNSPHNLLRLCLDCHTSHGNDAKLLRGVKEELLRRSQFLGQVPIYDCTADIATGEAVYVLDGVVYRADASDADKLATGLVRTKIGQDRCTVQRTEVLEGIAGLQSGQKYFLSPTCPGEIVTYETFDRVRDKKAPVYIQPIGRAESSTQLALNIEGEIRMAYDE